MRYFTMILIGLHYLHGKKITHRDLKPENILVNILPDGSDILFIGDFGISKQESVRSKYTLNGTGTVYYMAPEMIEGKESTTKVDMWALGVILYELFASILPFVAENNYLT